MRRALLSLLVLLAPAPAWAHGGNPAVADILAPDTLCPVADEGRSFAWADADSPAPSGPAYVDFYATTVVPETFFRTDFPDELEELPVALSILEPDPTNMGFWNTSTVATGVYWLWSHVREPPEEMSPAYISLSPVPIVVHHPPDPVPSALAITRPNNPLAVGDQTYRVEYTALDPTGTGRIRLEARPFREDDWHVIAENLPPVREGRFEWNTSQLPAGDWILRATMTDCTGRVTVAHTRFIFFISHPVGPKFDAGWDLDAGQFDAVVPDWCDQPPLDPMLEQCGVETVARDAGVADAGAPGGEEPGCACTETGGAHPAWSLLSLGALALLWRRRSA